MKPNVMLGNGIKMFAVVFLTIASAVVSHAQTPTNAPAKTNVVWKSSAAAGLTLARGNSKTLLATLDEKTEVKWSKNELNFGANGAYGETQPPGATSSTINAESASGLIQYNRLFTERLYGYARVDALHDEVADIRYRVSLGPGLGYYFIKAKKTELSGEIGPGYIFERLGGDNLDYVTMRVAEKFKHEISDRARIWESAEYLPQVDKFNNYILNGEIGIEADLSQNGRFALRCLLQDTYNNVPAAGREKNDAKLVAAIAYKF